MSIFAGVPLWLWGFTFSVCLRALIKRSFGTKLDLCECVLFCMLCLHVCVWACLRLSVALTPEAKSGGGETHPLCISLYRERIVLSLWVGEGRHLHGRLCESSLSNYKTRRVSSSTNFTFQTLKSSHHAAAATWHFLLLLYFLFLWLAFISQLSSHHLSLPFPDVVCFLVLLDPLLESPCWVLQSALPHHGNSKLSGWLHHVAKCFMSHCEFSLFPYFSPPLQVNTACFVTLCLNKEEKERTKRRFRN